MSLKKIFPLLFIIALPCPAADFTGQIWIALRGGETRKLAAVDVYLYKWAMAVQPQIRDKLRKMVRDTNDGLLYAGGRPQSRDRSYLLPENIRRFFVDLPSPDARVTTGPDGEFQFSADTTHGPWLILVVTSRAAGISTERYVWLVTTDSADSNGHITLSNQNLMSL